MWKRERERVVSDGKVWTIKGLQEQKHEAGNARCKKPGHAWRSKPMWLPTELEKTKRHIHSENNAVTSCRLNTGRVTKHSFPWEFAWLVQISMRNAPLEGELSSIRMKHLQLQASTTALQGIRNASSTVVTDSLLPSSHFLSARFFNLSSLPTRLFSHSPIMFFSFFLFILPFTRPLPVLAENNGQPFKTILVTSFIFLSVFIFHRQCQQCDNASPFEHYQILKAPNYQSLFQIATIPFPASSFTTWEGLFVKK